MVAEKPKRDRNRTGEYARRKLKNEMEAAASRSVDAEMIREEELKVQLRFLEQQTKGNPTDEDGDIDFAYRYMASLTVTPLMAPSTSAWSWYIYSRNTPEKFLEICAKRADAKAKMAGTITNQRMGDDRRNQFAVIERIEKQLTLDVVGVVNDLMSKFPRDVLRVCKKHVEAWKSFLAEECQNE